MFSGRQLRQLILPLICEQLLGILVGMIDIIMVSEVGEAAISGVSLVNEVNYLTITILGALASGGSVVVAQYIGFKDYQTSDKAAGQVIMIAGLVSTLMAAFMLLFGNRILDALYGHVDATVMEAAVLYLKITALSFPCLGIYNACTALFRSMNETRTTMLVSLLMNAVNIIGNYFGVYVFHLGVAGVAWPTLFSRLLAAVIMFILCCKEGRILQVRLRQIFTWNSHLIRKVLGIAIPNAVENSLFQVGRIIISTFVAFYGTVALAANGVAGSLFCLQIAASAAMQMAIVTVIGQCVGANDYKEARRCMKQMMWIGYGLTVINVVVMMLFLSFFMRLYSLSPEGVTMVRQIMIDSAITVCLFHIPSFVLPNGLRAAGDARYTMWIGTFSMLVIRVSGAWLLGTVLGLGLRGTWIAMYIDWVFRALFFILRYRSGKWTRFRVVD